MYAVVRTGGKQIRMKPGESIRVEKLPGFGTRHLLCVRAASHRSDGGR